MVRVCLSSSPTDLLEREVKRDVFEQTNSTKVSCRCQRLRANAGFPPLRPPLAPLADDMDVQALT